jgi:hypothetical protein
VPWHRSADLHCTVVLPQKGGPYWVVGARAPISRSVLYGCTPAKRGTALGCRCHVASSRSELYGCTPAKKGDRTGLKMPGHRSADLRCTVVLPQKGRPYSTVGARAPSSRSELYVYAPTKEGDRTVGARAPISRSKLYGYPPKGRPHWAVQVPGHRALDLLCTVTLPPKRETVLGCRCPSTEH